MHEDLTVKFRQKRLDFILLIDILPPGDDSVSNAQRPAIADRLSCLLDFDDIALT